GERRGRAPLVERRLPHQVHGEQRSDGDHEHRGEDRRPPLSSLEAPPNHPLVSTRRHSLPNPSTSTVNSIAFGRITSRSGPSKSSGGHSRCHWPAASRNRISTFCTPCRISLRSGGVANVRSKTGQE